MASVLAHLADQLGMHGTIAGRCTPLPVANRVFQPNKAPPISAWRSRAHAIRHISRLV